MTDRGNYGEGREGSASPEKNLNGEGTQDNIKKKRPRVGDLRKQPMSGGGNNDRNPYRSNSDEGYNQPYRSYGNRSENSYGNNNRSYNNNNRGYNNERNYNNNDGGGYRNNDGGGYRGNNSGGGYRNNDGGGYRSNNGGGGYRNNNSGGGYRNNSGGGGYRSNSGGGGYRNNNGGGGYRNNDGGGFRQQRGPKRIVKPVKYKENIDPDTPIRLNKYLANAGVCSRREADSYITAGVVKVNGEIVSELGVKVKRGDLVTFHDQPVRLESKVYVLLNKPKNCVTTSDDPENRLTVMDLVKGACPERIYPVGRLDRNTTGVLLLTNDGDLASKLTHPKFKKKKIYQVTLDRDVAIEDMQAIADGVELDDGEIHADSIAYQAEDMLNVVGIEIHSGRNRVVRRIFEKLGYQVIKLDRVYFAGLTKKNLSRGKWRYLTEREVNMLRMGAFE